MVNKFLSKTILLIFCVVLFLCQFQKTNAFESNFGNAGFSFNQINGDEHNNYGYYLLYTYKNPILTDALFGKIQCKNSQALSTFWEYNSEYAIGSFYWPNAYSPKISYQKENRFDIAIRTAQTLKNDRLFFDDFFGQIGFRGGFGGNPNQIITDAAFGCYSYAQGEYLIGYNYDILPGYQTTIHYADLIRTSAYYPLDFFRNSELGLGLSHDQFLFQYFQPLSFQLQRQNYPFQDQRFDLNYRFWLWNEALSLRCIFQKEKTWIMAQMVKAIQDIMLAPYYTFCPDQIVLGITLYFDQSIRENKFYQLSKRDNVPKEQHILWHDPYDLLPSNIDNMTLSELKHTITTPEEASAYTYWYLNYADDHNDLEGLTQLYAPEYVFNNKRGNCTEQTRLQAYLLEDDAYETRIVGSIASHWAHAILFYKDKTTGKWKAVDNTQGKIYDESADSIEELYSKIYPGWFNLVVKDKDGNGLYQIDSETKWYIEEWFNQ